MMIPSVNNVAVAVASFSEIVPDELWVAFGIGSRFQYIPTYSLDDCYNESSTESDSPSVSYFYRV